MPKLESSQHGPFTGVDASGGAFVNPQGTVPRASNLISIQRGSLATCDGSSVLAWHSGQIQSGDSKIIAFSVFQPTGVSPYYLALKQTASFPLGPPYFFSAAAGSVTGTLSGSHFYQVTAIDGIGGESVPAPSVNVTIGPSGSVELQWWGVANAYGYNIYRDGQLLATPPGVGTPCGGGTLPVGGPSTQPPIPLSTGTLPVLQTCGVDAAGQQSYRFAYIDDGSATALAPLTIIQADTLVSQAGVVQFTVASTLGLPPGQAFVVSGVTDINGNPILNGTYIITNIVNGTTFQAVPVPVIPAPPVIPPPPPPGTAPAITSISPASGMAGNTVTITGTNFGAVISGTVTFNGITASVTSWSDTSLVVTAPSGVTTGPVVVTVGGQPSNGVTFTVTGTTGVTIALANIAGGITITSDSPYSGQPGLSLSLQTPWSPSVPLAVGNTVTVSGTGLYDGSRVVAALSPTPDPYGMTLVAVSGNTAILLNQGQVTLP